MKENLFRWKLPQPQGEYIMLLYWIVQLKWEAYFRGNQTVFQVVLQRNFQYSVEKKTFPSRENIMVP